MEPTVSVAAIMAVVGLTVLFAIAIYQANKHDGSDDE